MGCYRHETRETHRLPLRVRVYGLGGAKAALARTAILAKQSAHDDNGSDSLVATCQYLSGRAAIKSATRRSVLSWPIQISRDGKVAVSLVGT